jgi:transglycosylase-like protein with SLT domain/DNA translocase FtsK/SpoIIIE-like protein
MPSKKVAEGEDDIAPIYAEAVKIVDELGTVAISTFQRRLRLGFGHAARLMARLYQNGIVGEIDPKTQTRTSTSQGRVRPAPIGQTPVVPPVVPNAPAPTPKTSKVAAKKPVVAPPAPVPVPPPPPPIPVPVVPPVTPDPVKPKRGGIKPHKETAAERDPKSYVNVERPVKGTDIQAATRIKRSQASLKHLNVKIRKGFSARDLQIYDLNEELRTYRKNTQDTKSSPEVLELGAYFINRINDIVNDLRNADTTILKINFKRIQHLRDDAKVTLTNETKTAILKQLDHVEGVIRKRFAQESKKEKEEDTESHSFTAFLKRNEVDLLSIVAGITANNRTVMWMTRYALRRRENRLNREQREKEKQEQHANIERAKLQEDRIGLRNRIEAQKVRISGAPSRVTGSVLTPIKPENETVRKTSGARSGGKSPAAMLGVIPGGKGNTGGGSISVVVNTDNLEKLVSNQTRILTGIRTDFGKFFQSKTDKDEQDEENTKEKNSQGKVKTVIIGGNVGSHSTPSGEVDESGKKSSFWKSLFASKASSTVISAAEKTSLGRKFLTKFPRLGKLFSFGARTAAAGELGGEDAALLAASESSLGSTGSAVGRGITSVAEGSGALGKIGSFLGKTVKGLGKIAPALLLAETGYNAYQGYNHPESATGQGSDRFNSVHDTSARIAAGASLAVGRILGDIPDLLFRLVGKQSDIADKITKALFTFSEGADPFKNIARAAAPRRTGGGRFGNDPVLPRSGQSTPDNPRQTVNGGGVTTSRAILESGEREESGDVFSNSKVEINNTNSSFLNMVKPSPSSDKMEIEEVKKAIVNEAIRQGVNPAEVLALAEGESGFRANAKSPTGATGVFQFIESTAKMMKIDRNDVSQNIAGGVAYWKLLKAKYNGNVQQALAAYKGVSVGGATMAAVKVSESRIGAYDSAVISKIQKSSSSDVPKLMLAAQPKKGELLAAKTDELQVINSRSQTGQNGTKPAPIQVVAPTSNIKNQTTITLDLNTRNNENTFKRNQYFDNP